MKGGDTPVVAVLNMKGGVGKTTASAHLSRAIFSKFHVSTTIIDFDPQFNLTQALFKRERYDDLRSQGKTIMAAMEPQPGGGLLEVRTTSSPPPPVSDIAQTLLKYVRHPEITIRVVPGDFALSKFTLMDHGAKLKDVEGRFSAFIENARATSEFVCIDCNPSSSFLTLCVLKSASHILVPIRADRYSILGLELLYEFVDSIPGLSPRPKFIAVLNDVKRNSSSSDVELELRAHSRFGALTLANRLYRSKHLTAHPDYIGFASDRGGPYSDQVRSELNALASELGGKIGLKEKQL